tara:strand:- start:142 stop:495 length:354 start_codon:yes stop_codon:yes gene_type:complete
MIRAAFRLAVMALAAQPYVATAQGQIGTVERGYYVCELPGTANGAAGIEQPEENFRIANASRYEADGGSGTYLRRGNRLTMTSGPRAGDSYLVVSDTFFRKIENGEPGRLRCVRTKR